MKQNFIIFSSQRSGSSYLMRALDKHPEILCAGGIFRKSISKRIKYPELAFNYVEKKKKRLFRIIPGWFIKKHLEEFYNHGDKEVRGFKLMVNHAEDIPSLIRVCDQQDIKVIVLKRKNIVRQAISLTMAQNAGLWVKSNDSSGLKYQIQIDIQRLVKNIRYFQRGRNLMDSTSFSVEPLVVYFEDLVGENSMQVFDSIYNYLGIQENKDLALEAVKKSKFSLDERIQNYSEVISLLNENDLTSYITHE